MFILPSRTPLSRSDTIKVCYSIVHTWQTSSVARAQILEQAKKDKETGSTVTIPRVHSHLTCMDDEHAMVCGKNMHTLTFELEDKDVVALLCVFKQPNHMCVGYTEGQKPCEAQQDRDCEDLHEIFRIVRANAKTIVRAAK